MSDVKLLEAVVDTIYAEVESKRGMPIQAETRLVEDLNLDSIDIVGITMRLEDRFHVDINVQEIKDFRSVADLMAQVSRQIGKTAA